MALRVSRRGLDLGGKVEETVRDNVKDSWVLVPITGSMVQIKGVRVLRLCDERDGGKYMSPRDQKGRGCEVSCDPMVSPNVLAYAHPLLAPFTHFNGYPDAYCIKCHWCSQSH